MAKIQTDKQRKLVKLLSENVGLPKPKTMLEMMLEAGYSEETARQQSGILGGIREELEPIVDEMHKHRDQVIKRMQSQLSKAKYRDLTDALDKLTKNIQLLSGKATENLNSKVVYLPERKENEHMDADAGPEAGACRRSSKSAEKWTE